MDKLASFFCACTRPRGQDEKNNEHEVYELSELTRFEDYYARIITDDAYHEISSSPTGEIDHVNFLHLSDSETLRDQLVSLAVDIHDSFSVIRQYIESWAIPCVVAYRNTDFDFTRIELLAIGSPATTNWISHMKEDVEVWDDLHKYGQITYTKDPLCVVLVPRHKLTSYATKYPIVTRTPRTQLIVPTPITAPPRVRYTFHVAPVGDSDSESEAS